MESLINIKQMPIQGKWLATLSLHNRPITMQRCYNNKTNFKLKLMA